jgi:hypothetical protein
MEVLEFIVKLIGTLTPILLFLMGWYIKKRDEKSKKELSERDEQNKKDLIERDKLWEKKIDIRMDIVIEKQQSLETKVMELIRTLDDHVCDDTFRKDYRKKIKFVLSSNLKNNLLHQDYKSLLSAWEEIYEKFGLNYYYSAERQMKQREREKYLAHQRNIIIGEFRAIVYENIQGMKVFKQMPVHFFDYLEQNQILNAFDVLILELGRNGLNDEKLIEKFEDCMDKFCDNFITSTVIWDALEKPVFKKDVI